MRPRQMARAVSFFGQHMRKNTLRDPKIESPEIQEETQSDEEKPEVVASTQELVKKARVAFEAKLTGKTFQPSLAEYLKLLQFEQELQQDDKTPKKIEVKWVEPESIFFEE